MHLTTVKVNGKKCCSPSTGPVSSLHLENGMVHVRSGWIHHMHAWDGSHISEDDTAKDYSRGGHKRLDRSYAIGSVQLA